MIFLAVSQFFNVMVFLNLLLALICAVLIIKLPTTFYLKYVSIPVIFFITYLMLTNGENILGRPFDSVPRGQFELVQYQIEYTDGVKYIELWLVKDGKSRLYVVQYDEFLESQLSKARSKMKNGIRQKIRFNMPGDADEGKILLNKQERKVAGSAHTPWNAVEFGDVTVDDVLQPKQD